jgi:hypothetical protein
VDRARFFSSKGTAVFFQTLKASYFVRKEGHPQEGEFIAEVLAQPLERDGLSPLL